MRLEPTIAAVLAKGDRRALFLDMGHFSADTATLGRAASSGRSCARATLTSCCTTSRSMQPATQHNSGTRTYEKTGARAAVVRTVSATLPYAEDRLTAVGWLRRAIELSGGRTVTVEPRRGAAPAATPPASTPAAGRSGAAGAAHAAGGATGPAGASRPRPPPR